MCMKQTNIGLGINFKEFEHKNQKPCRAVESKILYMRVEENKILLNKKKLIRHKKKIYQD